MKLPERDALIAAVRGMRDDCCIDCECEDKPNFHKPACPAFVPLRLQVDEDDWNLLHGETPEDDQPSVISGSSTVGFSDDDDVVEQIVDQLIEECQSSAVELDLWEEQAELVEWG